MLKRTFIFLFLLLAVIAGLGYTKYQQIQAGIAMMAASAPPVVTVEVTTAELIRWQPRVSAVGTLTAREGIDVATEVEGIIEQIHFESGQKVQKGDLLIALNDDVEQADMVSLQARRDLAETLFKRNEKLWKQRALSQTDFDQAGSNFKVVEANLLAIKARIARKSIRAPFTGVLGIRHANTGQYVAPGTPMVSLQDLGVLYTDFSVPERYLPDVAVGQMVNFEVSAYPGRTFTGEVMAIDARVDEATRNINVRAQLENLDNLLRPGMYADISLLLNEPVERVIVPGTSIVFSSFGNALFVVEQGENDTMLARRVSVTTGEQRGDLVEILSGLEGGELVVQAGVSKLRNGATVAINERARLTSAQ